VSSKLRRAACFLQSHLTLFAVTANTAKLRLDALWNALGAWGFLMSPGLFIISRSF
jgi:hypothetical protein